MSDHPIDRLLREHVSILAQVSRFENALNLLAAGDEEQEEEILQALNATAGLTRTELDAHRRKEDDALFPILEQAIGPQGPTQVMRIEHSRIHELGGVFRATLKELHEEHHPAIESGSDQLHHLLENGGDRKAILETGRELVDLLRLHFEKEEQVLFPMARTLLDENTCRHLMTQFDQIEGEHSNDVED